MNILLVQPKMNKRPMDTDLKTRMSPSLGLLVLKKLTPPEHTVTILNENIEKLRTQKRYFKNGGPDLVGITVTVDVLPRAAEIAALFRSAGVPVVAGGIHVTACPIESLAFFDTVCIGMAERLWPAILRDAARGRLQKIYRNTAPVAGEEICPPDYAFAASEGKYLYTNVISTSRGCPHRCDFCYNSCAEAQSYINRPVADVLEDIRALGTKHVMFIDDNFIGNPGWTRELLCQMRGMGLTWHAAVTTRLHNHPDLLDQMAEAGCQSLFIGFESINPAALQKVHKQNVVAQYSALVAAIHARGIMVNASMVFGLDGDDETVFDATLRWLVENKVETLTSHIMTPYPGTKLHQRLLQEGRITDGNLAHYNTAHVVFSPSDMDDRALQAGYLRMYRRFYSWRNILRRYPAHPKQRRAYLLFNFLYRKYGWFTAAVAKVIPMGLLGRLAALVAYRPARKAAVPPRLAAPEAATPPAPREWAC